MSYRVVRGEFHLFYQGNMRRVSAQPDGDSIWFKPQSKQHLANLGVRAVKYNGGGFAQLRFEGIDALELHFETAHQALQLAKEARDLALDRAGFNEVTYTKKGLHVKTATPHPIPGHILTRSIDPYGRPVSFVYEGHTNRQSGTEIFLDVALLNQSINAKLVQAGHAYPTFYTGLPTDLRARIKQLARGASRTGLWRSDVSMRGASISSLARLQQLVLWPKLFRRLVSYFKDHPNSGLSKFFTWLRADEDRDDAIWIGSRSELGNLHDVVTIQGNRIRMQFPPDDLIITPR